MEHFSPGRSALAAEWVLEKHFLEEAEAGRQSRRGRLSFSIFASGEEEQQRALPPDPPFFRAALGPAAQACLLGVACVILPP